MADQEKGKHLDEMLDSLLANYSSVEPRPGLQTRILATLRDAEEKKTPQGWWNFKWLWAGAVATAIIVAAVLIGGRHRIEPPTNVVVKKTQPAPQPAIQPHAPIAPTETVRSALSPYRPPKDLSGFFKLVHEQQQFQRQDPQQFRRYTS